MKKVEAPACNLEMFAQFACGTATQHRQFAVYASFSLRSITERDSLITTGAQLINLVSTLYITPNRFRPSPLDRFIILHPLVALERAGNDGSRGPN